MRYSNATEQDIIDNSIDAGNGVRQLVKAVFIDGKMVKPPMQIKIKVDADSYPSSLASDSGLVSQELASTVLDKEGIQ